MKDNAVECINKGSDEQMVKLTKIYLQNVSLNILKYRKFMAIKDQHVKQSLFGYSSY